MMNNEKYISFKGITITRYDRKILKGPNFLNDTIIDFYFRFLELSYGEEDILLVSPSVSFWLANSADADGVKETAESLKIHEKQLVLFTINDEGNQDESNGGGLHWSLLVYYRPVNYFVHHDSVKGFNKCEARTLYMAIKDHVNVPKTKHNDTNNDDGDGPDGGDDDDDLTSLLIGLRGPNHRMREGNKKQRLCANNNNNNNRRKSRWDVSDVDVVEEENKKQRLRTNNNNNNNNNKRKSRWDVSDVDVAEEEEEEEACYQECTTPQQSNLYDCGLYVMKMTAVICEWYLSWKLNLTTDPLWCKTLLDKVTPCYVQEEMRTDILKLIDLLEQEGY